MVNYKHLKKSELHQHFQNLVSSERKTTAEVIECLKEIDQRRLYLEMGFGSLFAYLTEGIGYSAASAMRRISAARIARDVPEMKDSIEKGTLNLMQVSVVAQGIRALRKEGAILPSQQKKELLQKIQNLNFQETQAVVAKELELPLQKQESVRVQADDSRVLNCTFSKEQMQSLEKAREILSHKYPGATWSEFIAELAKLVIELKDPSKLKGRALKNSVISNRSKVSTGESLNQRDSSDEIASQTDSKFARAADLKEILRLKSEEKTKKCCEPDIQTSDPFTSTVEYAAGKSNVPDNRKLSKGSSKNESTISSKNSTKINTKNNARVNSRINPGINSRINSRISISTANFREVHRKFSCCQFVDPNTKRKCGSRFQLQVDHIQPVWAGGGNEISNLQLLCAQHNRQKYFYESGIQRK